ncbi:MAG TPA: hypothetical protein VKS79_05550 [Gemmataceae bacterium]|nr:hypothetical protein [Gemmataceae bacterium]
MITPTQQEILRRLTYLCEKSPDVRFGQLLAHLGFLSEDMNEHGLWDVEDDELLRVIERHAVELAERDEKAV